MNSQSGVPSVPPINPITPASSRSNYQSYSARTPGEGYPFPRFPRPCGNFSTKATSPTGVANNVDSQMTTIAPQIKEAPSPVINTDVFKQLLAMEDDNRDGKFKFTRGLIDLYYEDAGQTLQSMGVALQLTDYRRLASLAHFLRGSAASVGISEVAAICEAMEMAIISKGPLDEVWLRSQLQSMDQAHLRARIWFNDFYAQHALFQGAQ